LKCSSTPSFASYTEIDTHITAKYSTTIINKLRIKEH